MDSRQRYRPRVGKLSDSRVLPEAWGGPKLPFQLVTLPDT